MDPRKPFDLVNRRDLLKVTGAAALIAALDELLPGSFLLRVSRAEDVPNAVVHLGSVEKGAQYAAVKEKIRAALQATRDLSLIKDGDLVVVKVVSNSPYKYPMVTHPWALQAVIEIVKERTNNVRVVDQVGFEHCFFTGDDKLNKEVQDLWKRFAPGAFISEREQVSSGMEALERNGLKGVAEKAGAQVFSGDHDADYIQVPNDDPQYGKASDPEFAHWTAWKDLQGKQHPQGFRVNKYALGFPAGAGTPAKPPHVISISRISAHIWAGSTGPTKAYYGWIHPQDRVRSHTDIDPISESPVLIMGKLLPLAHPEVRHQAERITEVAAFFQSYFARIRENTYFANLVVALDTYSDVGPDWGVQPLPDGGRGVIAASEDVVALDAVATAKLVDAIRSVPQKEREKVSRGQRWNVLDLFSSAGRDRIQNAWQTLNYSKTRGLWNTFFGSVSFLQQIDTKRPDPTVWEVGQVRTGVEMGLARNMRVDLLDDRARLTANEAALLANEPETPGMLKKLDTGKEKR